MLTRTAACCVARRGAVSAQRSFADEAVGAGGIPAQLTLNFSSPNNKFYEGKKVDMVTLKATSGEFGVLPGHVPTIAQLQPGVLTAEWKEDGAEVSESYFVASGFAYIKSNSVTDVCAMEACKLEDVDAEAVAAQLAEAEAALSSASEEADKAEAQIKVEVLEGLKAALA